MSASLGVRRYAGVPQIEGTCWFNATVNGFLLGPVGSRVVLSAIQMFKRETRRQEPDDVAYYQALLSYLRMAHSRLPRRSALHAVLGRSNALSETRWLAECPITRLMTFCGIHDHDGGRTRWVDERQRFLNTLNIPPSRVSLLDIKSVGPVADDAEFSLIKRRWNQPPTMVFFDHRGALTALQLTLRDMTRRKLVIDVNGGVSHTYTMDHCILKLEHDHGADYHAVPGTFCDGVQMVYDSNRAAAVPVEWFSQLLRADLLRGIYPSCTGVTLSYICFVLDSYSAGLPSLTAASVRANVSTIHTWQVEPNNDAILGTHAEQLHTMRMNSKIRPGESTADHEARSSELSRTTMERLLKQHHRWLGSMRASNPQGS